MPRKRSSWSGSRLLSFWAALYRGTPSEHSMEPSVAALGLPYRFQHPVWGCGSIVDFAWPDLKVILEIDGREHATTEGKAKDSIRSEKLAALGWHTILRCTNEEALDSPQRTLKKLLLKSGVPALVEAAKRLTPTPVTEITDGQD